MQWQHIPKIGVYYPAEQYSGYIIVFVKMDFRNSRLMYIGQCRLGVIRYESFKTIYAYSLGNARYHERPVASNYTIQDVDTVYMLNDDEVNKYLTLNLL